MAPALTGTKLLQLASGTATLPLRTSKPVLVAAGWTWSALSCCQPTLLPASNTREVKLPAAG